MSTPNPENFPNSLVTYEDLVHALHDRVMDFIRDAEENNHPDLDTEVDEDNGEVGISFWATGRQHDDPLMIMAPDGTFKFMTINVYISDERGDMEVLGREADGTAAPIMLMDNMAELQRRTIHISTKLYDSPEAAAWGDPGWWEKSDTDTGRPPGYDKGWIITYDMDTGWAMRFWKDRNPLETLEPLPHVAPEQADSEQLVIAVNEAEARAQTQAD